MSQIAIASSPPKRDAFRWAVPLLAAAVLVSTGWWFFLRSSPATASGTGSGLYQPIVTMDLDVTVSKDGEMQAVTNIDIFCLVEGQTTLQNLVKEGASVKKGEVIATLDSSAIRTKIDDSTLDLQKADAELTTAREMKEIQDLQNAANIEAAESALALAQIDLKKYTEGTYPQDLANSTTDLEWSRITLRNKEEDLLQTNALFEKGFVTGADVQKSELEVTTARNGVSKAETAVKVLKEYSYPMDSASKQNAVTQAEQKLVRTKRENASNLSQKVADLQAKTQAVELKKRLLEGLQTQMAACTIHAPADGMVVYATSGDRNAQNLIQEGAQVRERQLLFRLPDLSKMKAVVRVSEAQVASLSPGQPAVTRVVGVGDTISGSVDKISVLADSGQRWWNPDLKEYPVDVLLERTPANLKPGVGCNVTVYVKRRENVPVIPLAALYAAGEDRYFFARDGDQNRPVKIKIGASNETHAEILEGAMPGQQALILQSGQGRQLLEKAGIDVKPTTDKSDQGERRRKRDPSAAAVESGTK